jgi:hypothetical protein
VAGCSLVAQTHNPHEKQKTKGTDEANKIHLKTVKKSSTKRKLS